MGAGSLRSPRWRWNIRRILPFSVAGALVAGVLLSPVFTYLVGAFRPVDAVTVDQAMHTMTSQDGRPALILLYGPRCPLSRSLMPQFVALSRRAEAGGADVFAYSTGEGPDALLVGGFLLENDAPFEARRILPWTSGALAAGLRSIGIAIGSQWTRPLVAVRARNGHIIYQAEGVRNLEVAAQVLETELRAAPRDI
jgi:hypothetical protein